MAYRAPSRLFDSATSPRNLTDIYIDHVRKGAARGRDGVVPEVLHREIDRLSHRLSADARAGTHEFTQYRELLLSKGAGRTPRVVSIPTARDRILLKALAAFLGTVYPASRGVIPQQRIDEVHEALLSTEFDAFVRLDVRDFYPSVRHDSIRSALAVRIKKQAILDLILRAVETPTVPDGAPRRPVSTIGIPQGLALSNLLAEAVVASIDHEMTRDHRCVYFRFVDDVLMLCQRSDANEIAETVRDLFADIGLDVHGLSGGGEKAKIGLIIGGFDYLGYCFKGDLVSIRRPSVLKIESALARSFTHYKRSRLERVSHALSQRRCEWYVNLTITGFIHQKTARGWLPYFRQMNDLTLLKQLDATVQRFMRRFGLPADWKPKTFMRSYWAWRHPNGRHLGYIPNFDTASVQDKRLVLQDFISVERVSAMNNLEVSRRFDYEITKIAKDLERDIGSIS